MILLGQIFMLVPLRDFKGYSHQLVNIVLSKTSNLFWPESFHFLSL